ncbi:hypothetical protein MKK75_07215 [Methylobacterium sp. J-030]|uniref:hypothetical protein n=1 Tax=Methylobacterium sp. J-030 TaxID=2836627 RepID=UPI001FBA3FCD|nr:hypothetical protein [Methylobacterium sp. J-030]MCJ2068596.1 hypothetical protein [Methylobacterium sp. J-030]
MNFISWLLSRVFQFVFGRSEERKSSSVARESDAADHESSVANTGRNFDEDYRGATKILMMRLSNRFPDNYYARTGSDKNSTRDFGDERAEAIDTASAAIAAALRSGATVKQAAEAGAASVGI